MADAITIEISDEARRILNKSQNLRTKILQAIAKEHNYQNQLTVAHAREKHLSGGQGNLNVRTGRLRRSVRASKAVIVSDGVVSAIGTNVVYAAIHEFGGQIPPHRMGRGMKLRKAQQVRGFSAQGVILRGSTFMHPGSKIPQRSYIRRSYEERKEEIGHAMSMAIVNAWNGGNQ